MTDLENLSACFDRRCEASRPPRRRRRAAFRKARACPPRAPFRSFHMEGVRGGDDDRVDVADRQASRRSRHRTACGSKCRRHPLAQIVRHVAYCIEVGVASLGAGFEMRGLGNRTAAKNADAQPSVVLAWHHAFSSRLVAAQRKSGIPGKRRLMQQVRRAECRAVGTGARHLNLRHRISFDQHRPTDTPRPAPRRRDRQRLPNRR